MTETANPKGKGVEPLALRAIKFYRNTLASEEKNLRNLDIWRQRCLDDIEFIKAWLIEHDPEYKPEKETP